MRRKDREMSAEFGLQVIDRARFGILSVIDENGEPYGVPLSIVRKDNILYFHSAQDGKKVRIFANNPLVRVAFVGATKIPELYTNQELDEILKDESNATMLISKVFTTEYESAMVKGYVKQVQDEAEKIMALRMVCEKYTPTKMDYFDIAIKAGLGRANAYRIDIEEITAKRKKYDEKGEEMKWGRMD